MKHFIFRIIFLILCIGIIGCSQNNIWDNINDVMDNSDGDLKIENFSFTPGGSTLDITIVFSQPIDTGDGEIKVWEKKDDGGGVFSTVTSYTISSGTWDTDNKIFTVTINPQPVTDLLKIELFEFHSGAHYLNDVITGFQFKKTLTKNSGIWN